MSGKDLPSEKMFESLLDRAEGEKLVELIAFIDGVRDKVDIEAKVDRIRPKLAMLRPPRPMSFARIVVVPFEDILVAAAQWQAESGCIARTTIGTILEVSRDAFSNDELEGYKKQTAGKTMSDIAAYCELGESIWPRAASQLANKAKTGNVSPLMKLQLERASALLNVARQVCPLAEFLPPRPMGDLSSYQKQKALETLSECERRSSTAFAAALQWLLARSFKPSVILDFVLHGHAGVRTPNRDDIVHDLALQTLARQRLLLENLRREPRSIDATINMIEEAAGTVLSLKSRKRALLLTQKKLAPVETALHKAVSDNLAWSIRQGYFPAIDRLNDPLIDDKQVQGIERMARTINRLNNLAKPCGIEKEAIRVLHQTGGEASEKLASLYGEKAEAMVLVDQMRIYELIFGSIRARSLWRAFDNTRATTVSNSEADEPGTSPSRTMIAALLSA